MLMCNGQSVPYRACYRVTDVSVSLTPEEIFEATEHGKALYAHSQMQALHGKMRDKRSFTTDDVDGERAQIIGAIAEMAGAKAAGVAWPKHIDNFKGADLPHNIEVRLIGRQDFGLRVYKSDIDSRRVLGIIMPRGEEHLPCRVPGWINAVYGKRPEWLADPGGRQQPVYLVPQERLRPISLLLNLIRKDLNVF